MVDAPAVPEVRAGFCAIVGLPNVGKSTLLNRILGRHLVAVSAKPQTTRDRIVGVHTIELPGETPDHAQIAYVDTPGVQTGKGPLRRYMRDAALAATADADVVLMIVDATDKRGRLPDRMAEPDIAALQDASRRKPIIIALNKVDRVGKPELLPVIEAWSKVTGFDGLEVVPISAATGDNVERLEQVIARKLPVGPLLFPADTVTDRSPQFIAQEIIREQLYHQLGKELPYACAVQVETWTERKGELVIGAVILVERESQKPIVVGRAGHRIRELGIAARQ
ncbi:MAG TPA: GTPase Era, partial [Kofleriaceae bacterium]|nr:GTPase Era [Kofleriaceae bacterium]